MPVLAIQSLDLLHISTVSLVNKLLRWLLAGVIIVGFAGYGSSFDDYHLDGRWKDNTSFTPK
jgi:hypothetical protein